jgi:outer membrane protein assembly factor BamB
MGRAEEVLCINAFNGTPIWRYVLEEPINVDAGKCSPAIADDNLIIVTSTSYHGNLVYCLDTEGNGDGTTHLHWEKTLIYDSEANAFSPSIAYGYAYVSSISSDITGTIYCLNTTTGDTVWSRVLGAELIPSGISIADGKLYLGTYGFPLDTTSTIFCLDAFTGAPLWRFRLEPTGGVCVSPAIANGRVYFSTFRMVSAGIENPRVICFGDENHQPRTPEKPLGPEIGETGESYIFSTTTTDDDGDPVRYGWDWDGNGIVDDWTDYYPSGENVPISHTWTDEGTYQVQVQAQDIYEVESSWSEPLTIQIGSLTLSAAFVSGKGVNLLITNSGTIPATAVAWSLDITGGLYIKPRDASGSLPLLNPGASAEVTVPVFGFGFGIFKPLPQISITVTCAEGKSIELSENARIFLSFVFFIEPKV